MADFSERDEAFFRSGEFLSEVPAPRNRTPSWWQRLFMPELREWSPLPFDEYETADYASYELIDDADIISVELAA
jgi:hypothetical protein